MRRTTAAVAGAFAALALATPVAAQFTPQALGPVTTSGSQVTIHTSDVTGPRWFGVRVFTVPAGTMAGHNVLRTANTALSYSGAPNADGRVLCVSDFGGTGSPGGSFGSGSAVGAAADPALAMLGGFAGAATGCTDGASGDLKVTMNTTGPIVQAFYGTFYGDTPATWRGDVGNVTGNPAWWNLWGNFTSLGYASTG